MSNKKIKSVHLSLIACAVILFALLILIIFLKS